MNFLLEKYIFSGETSYLKLVDLHLDNASYNAADIILLVLCSLIIRSKFLIIA